MARHDTTDWAGEEVGELLAMVRGGSFDQRRQAACEFDWNSGDLSRLGWMMSQKDIDLGTAARVFLNGAPERFQHVQKRAIPEEERKRCNLLDAIHKRLVAGFYLPDPVAPMGSEREEMLAWIAKQEEDRARGRVGRWNFRAELFEPLTLASVHPVEEGSVRDLIDKDIFKVPERPKRASLLRELFSSILG